MSIRQMNYTFDSDPLQQGTSASVPYPPSAIDRFTDWVKRLPFPYWLTYLGLFLLQSAGFLVLSWIDGWLPLFTFDPMLLVFPLWLWGPLAIVTYLDSLSLDALSNFGPLLNIPDDRMQSLRYEFTTMPSRGVAINSLIWSILYLVLTFVSIRAVLGIYEAGLPLTVLVIIEGLISYAVGGVLYYHSIRQLRLVSRTVRLVDQFDLFQLDPVYSFSVLTSRTGICWIVLSSLTLLIWPVEVSPIPTLAMLGLQLVCALAAFALPLRIVNQRLVAEKRRLLVELDQRIKGMLARLHHAVDGDQLELEEVEALNTALAGLNLEREIMARIPTWPWRPGLFSGFLSIAVLPVILFVVQLGLEKWLGG